MTTPASPGSLAEIPTSFPTIATLVVAAAADGGAVNNGAGGTDVIAPTSPTTTHIQPLNTTALDAIVEQPIINVK